VENPRLYNTEVMLEPGGTKGSIF